MNFSLWVDADSCPVQVRELVLRFVERLKIPCFFVANRQIPLPPAVTKKNIVEMIVTENTEGAADEYIVEKAQVPDLVITRDIPLAQRLVEKNITVINDRGKLFTAESIREDVSIRNFNYELAQMGIQPDRTGSYNKKNLNDFANCLDRELQKKLRQ